MGLLRKLSRRRPPVPAAARRFLETDERALAWAQAVSGQVLVASPRGLHIVGESAHRLIGWHEMNKATWASRTLTVIEAKPVDGGPQVVDQRPWRLEFDEPGGIPVVLRRRVEASVAVTEHRPVAGGVRVVGRKVSGSDGLLWQYRLDTPRALAPVERIEIEGVLAAVRREHEPRGL